MINTSRPESMTDEAVLELASRKYPSFTWDIVQSETTFGSLLRCSYGGIYAAAHRDVVCGVEETWIHEMALRLRQVANARY